MRSGWASLETRPARAIDIVYNTLPYSIFKEAEALASSTTRSRSYLRMDQTTTLRTDRNGADRDRTGDPRLAKPVLSQLSYNPAEASPRFAGEWG